MTLRAFGRTASAPENGAKNGMPVSVTFGSMAAMLGVPMQLKRAKVLRSAVANAEYQAREGNAAVDVDALYVKHAVINEGPKLKRFTPAAMGRATPIQKRTSHVEIVVAERGES